MHRSRVKWDDFLAFVDDRGISATPPEQQLELELRQAGVNVDRVQAKVEETTRLWRARDAQEWVERGRVAQALFESRVREKDALAEGWISKRYRDASELWAAIASGGLGPVVQQHAAVFFRNRDGQAVSERDLRSFIDD